MISGAEIPDQIADWPRAIGELIVVHQQIRELDHERIWENELPRVGADYAEIERAENALGKLLDARFRQFLRHADGWRGFYQWVDLFGTADLLGEPLQTALARLEELDRTGVLSVAGAKSSELLPIALTRPGYESGWPDLFALTHAEARNKGSVLWFSREEVDRYQTFDAFYLAMVDYNREEIGDLLKEVDKSEGPCL